MSETVRVHVFIRGCVQGVGYRAWTQATALERGLEGWVRNCRDGAVEALFVGSPAEVAAMLDACRHGPYFARVDAIEQTDASADAAALQRPGERFSVLGTV